VLSISVRCPSVSRLPFVSLFTLALLSFSVVTRNFPLTVILFVSPSVKLFLLKSEDYSQSSPFIFHPRISDIPVARP